MATQQSKSLIYRFILIAVLIIASLWQLYPTFNLSRLSKKEQENFAKAHELANVSIQEIKDALTEGNLESVILKSLKNPSNDKEARGLCKEIVALDEKVLKSEKRTIKRGLDLQGGTFLIYEVDFPNFLTNFAKNPDTQLKQLLQEVDHDSRIQNLDFFDVFQQRFEAKNLSLNRYFGKKGESDRKIISNLRTESQNAIDRSLEVLRNRIDQFGVSEPSITKQGNRRIVVELAGILDVNRAKAVIGKTAQLEFKLLRDPEYTRSILLKIDEIVKKRRFGALDSTALAAVTARDTMKADSTTMKEKVRDEKEVNLDELFGTASETEKPVGGDTTLSVDKNMFEEHPFLSLLGNVGNMMAAPKQNMKAVDILLNYPEVKKVIPDESEFLWHSKPERINGKDWYPLYFVKKTPEITGDYIANANVSVVGEASSGSANRAGQVEVILDLNSKGAKDFARITGANIGKPLAIILDSKVASAPTIRDRIPNGRASITGMRDMNEAKDLTVVLRAGALPAQLENIEERTVGPSLGADSIYKGKWSAIIGLIVVAAFMAFYYRWTGIIADLALVLNILFIMAAMAIIHGTLTLPGIAGIALTFGMAVDANVLINERIKEELRSGRTNIAAIDAGYARAFSAIFDSNLTTLFAGIILYQFGTGPIRGFALTLMIGIAASMFTAIVVTRFIFDFVTSRWKIKRLSI